MEGGSYITCWSFTAKSFPVLNSKQFAQDCSADQTTVRVKKQYTEIEENNTNTSLLKSDMSQSAYWLNNN